MLGFPKTTLDLVRLMFRSRRARLLVLPSLLVAVALPASASAAPRQGLTTIDLGGKAVKSLRDQGVTISAKRPAKIVKGELRLPVIGGLVTGSATLNQGGALVLRRKEGRKRLAIEITRLQVRLGRTSSVVGTVGSKRFPILSIAGKGASLNAVNGSASLRGARVTLSERAAGAIKKKLALKRLPAAAFGAATVDAIVTGSGGGNGGGGGGGAPGGSGPPASGPVDPAPPAKDRPGGAVDLAGATVKWTLRDSWVRYVSTEKAIAALDGAIPDPAVDGKDHPCADAPGDPGPLVYTYTLPFASGWYDPGTGTTSITTTGGVHFSYPMHGIDFSIRNLVVEVSATGSLATGLFMGNGVKDPAGTRGAVVDLTTPSPLPVPGSSTQLKAKVPKGGSESVFAGFYAAGDGFGCISVTY